MSEAVIVSLIAAVPASITAIIALFALSRVGSVKKDVKDVHLIINSRMDQLLETTAKMSRMAGTADERSRDKSDDIRSAK